MGSWQVGLGADVVIALAYTAICLSVVVPLHRSRQLRTNALAVATAAIFLVGAAHHTAHAVHLVLPSFGVDDAQGLALRTAWGWSLASWDVAGALVAGCYLVMRRTQGPSMAGAQLFHDYREREQQALELNDQVLQGLVVAKMALDLDQHQKAEASLSVTITSASRFITGLLGSQHHSLDLLRSAPASVGPTDAPVSERTPS